mgnify:CR=1 FL=1
MSIGRLMLSVRDELRLKLELTEDECHVMPDGRPMPSCGQRFIAIYAHSWNASPDDFNASEGLVEWYGLLVQSLSEVLMFLLIDIFLG